MQRLVPDIVRAWSTMTPAKATLIESDRTVTYAALNDWSNRIVNALIAANVRPGSHVAFLVRNSAAFVEIWVGANKARCALVPLN